jgi:hypothetical protein
MAAGLYADGLDSIGNALLTARDIIPYMLSIMPDALLPASGVYALFTLSSTFGMFFVSLVEARLILLGIHMFAHHFMDVANFAQPGQEDALCRNRLTPSPDWFEGEGAHPYTTPSRPMYMLGVACAYVFNTLNNQSKELEALGPAFSTRYYVSLTFLILLIIVVGAFRIMYNCEFFYNVLVSSSIGLIVGTFLVMQNKRLFGDSIVNMLGIPHLRNRAATGKKLYVCPK